MRNKYKMGKIGDVRCALDDDGLYFCWYDLCKEFGLLNKQTGTITLENVKSITCNCGSSGNQTFITGKGLWLMILNYDTAFSKAIKEFLSSQVLPSLLKSGVYVMDSLLETFYKNPEYILSLYKQFKQEMPLNPERTAEMKQLEMKRLCYNAGLQRLYDNTTVSIAKELRISVKALDMFLYTEHVVKMQGGDLLPFSHYQKEGYANVRKGVYIDNEGMSHVKMITVWTVKGRRFIIDLYRSKMQ